MIHARDDYNRIQDPAGLIPDDEPVFLIRAQDAVGAATVREWANLHYRQGASDEPDSIYRKAMDHANLMDAWPKKKRADLPVPSMGMQKE